MACRLPYCLRRSPQTTKPAGRSYPLRPAANLRKGKSVALRIPLVREMRTSSPSVDSMRPARAVTNRDGPRDARSSTFASCSNCRGCCGTLNLEPFSGSDRREMSRSAHGSCIRLHAAFGRHRRAHVRVSICRPLSPNNLDLHQVATGGRIPGGSFLDIARVHQSSNCLPLCGIEKIGGVTREDHRVPT